MLIIFLMVVDFEKHFNNSNNIIILTRKSTKEKYLTFRPRYAVIIESETFCLIRANRALYRHYVFLFHTLLLYIYFYVNFFTFHF